MAEEADEIILAPRRDVDRWEYLEERIDLGQVWLERDSLPPHSKLKGRASGIASSVRPGEVLFYQPG